MIPFPENFFLTPCKSSLINLFRVTLLFFFQTTCFPSRKFIATLPQFGNGVASLRAEC